MIFVRLILADAGNKNFKYPAVLHFAHHVNARIPGIEIADDGNFFCHRRIDAEHHSVFAVDFREMRAEIIICFVRLTKQEVVKHTICHKPIFLLLTD